MSTKDREQQRQGLVIVGVIMVAIGISLLADRITDRQLRFSNHLWPLVLIVIGSARFLGGMAACDGHTRRRPSGLWLIYVGVWGLISEFHMFGFNYGTSWPLLVIGAGLMVVWRSLDTRGTLSLPSSPTGSRETPSGQQEH